MSGHRYWRGAQARLVPALALGLVVGLVLRWSTDVGVGGACVVGLLSATAAVLLPGTQGRA